MVYVERKRESMLTTCEADVIAAPDVTPPTVAIIRPLDGTTATVPDTLTVVASASDDVRVRSVTFFIDDVSVFTDTEAPFEYAWTFDMNDNGTHRLRADALVEPPVSAPAV